VASSGGEDGDAPSVEGLAKLVAWRRFQKAQDAAGGRSNRSSGLPSVLVTLKCSWFVGRPPAADFLALSADTMSRRVFLLRSLSEQLGVAPCSPYMQLRAAPLGNQSGVSRESLRP